MASARPSIQISLEGYDALSRAFSELPAKIQSKFLRPALREGAKVMLASARRAAPRSDKPPHLDMSLKVKAMKRKRGRIGFIVITGKREELGIRQSNDIERYNYNKYKRLERLVKREGTSAGGLGVRAQINNLKRHSGPGYYPAHIEYGYRKRDGTHVPANPWMKRALEDGRAEATEAVAQELSRRLKSYAGLDGASDAEAFGGPDVEVTV